MISHNASMAPPMNELVSMDATVLAGAIRSGEVSCVEVMAAYLEQIAVLNPKVNAIVALQEREPLMAQARELDAELERGAPRGPLHGLPFAVKDLQPVKGIRTTKGSALFKDFIPAADGL